MRPEDLARLIDHTILKPEATPADIDRVIDEALEHRFASVCVNGRFVQHVRTRLDEAQASADAEGRVLCCAVAGFPLGATTPIAMVLEATSLAKGASSRGAPGQGPIRAGAQEIDVVAWLPRLFEHDAEGLRADLLETVRSVRAVSGTIVVKVILETAALRAHAKSDADFESMIQAGCRAARESGCDFVKTSTGFHPAGGATVEAVRLMARHASGLGVKASGGIRTYDDAMRMIDAGATRLGCSSSVPIYRKAN